MNVIINTDPDRWPSRISSRDGSVYVDCRRPEAPGINQEAWTHALSSVVESLCGYRSLRVGGSTAVAALLNDLPEVLQKQSGIVSVAYAEVDESGVYSWPEPNAGTHRGPESSPVIPSLPFAAHQWTQLPLYRGNYGPVSNVQFGICDAARVQKGTDREVWFVLLEAKVFESGNDAILQKTAFVEVSPRGPFTTHESDQILENAGGGGPYDLIMGNLVVSARNDVIAQVSSDLGNVLVKLDLSSFTATQIDTFRAPNPELIPVAKDIDVEVMKYLRRFPEHVTQMPAHAFEKIIAEVLRSRGFSDIQLNVRKIFGEIDIVAFESKQGKRVGHIVECKRYRHSRRVTLREAHVLAMKRILMKDYGIDRAMLVTTSDFTKATRGLYDSAWGMQLKALDEVLEWLRTYKPPKDIYYM